MEDSINDPVVSQGDAPVPELHDHPAASPNSNEGEKTHSTLKPPAICQHLTNTLSLSDNTLSRLNDLISSAYGQERVLATIGYSSQIVYYALSSRALSPLITRLSRSKPSTADSSAKPHLLALASLITETRTALRLFGLIPIWKWGSSTLKSPPRDPVLRAIAYTQVFVNIIYQLFENVAFLTAKGVLSKRAVERWAALGRWSIWSTRAWLSHVLLEFVRLSRERQLSARRAAASGVVAGEKKESIDDEEDIKVKRAEAEAKAQGLRAWKKSLVNNLAWVPLCAHWSFEQGIGVPDSMVGVLSMTAAAWTMCDLWKATAVAS